ncbi:MAG: VWA domain-containing protein [Planctomycetes bacterium]|nr:VWA domain-containing protein [Planctomycetota bacterium]
MNVQLISLASGLVAQTDSFSDPNWRIRWDWNWPLWASVLAALLVVGWIGVWYAREISPSGKPVRAALSLLRLVAILIAVVMFAQPTMEWFRLTRPRLVVLIDQSASMGTHDVLSPDANEDIAELSRLDAVKRLLVEGEEPFLDRLAANFQLEVVAFDRGRLQLDSQNEDWKKKIRSLNTSGDAADGTNLGGAIGYALQELPGQVPVAVVVFTDGVTTQGPLLEETVRLARRLRVPLYPVAVGSEKRRPDVAIESLLVEDLVFPGDRLQVEATLRATGFAGQTATVKLLAAETQTVLAQTDVELPVDEQETLVRLALRPTEPGDLALELVVEPLEGEANKENNVARQVIEVSDKKIKTLLVQASPSYEYRSLKSLLQRDPAIDLRVLLQEADVDFSEVEEIAIPEFPVSEQELNRYDVLIFGDVDPALLPRRAWPAIEKFVSGSAGGMICIAGPRFMPRAYRDVPAMQMLLPIEYARAALAESTSLQTYPIELTAIGRGVSSLQLGNTEAESAAIWHSLPAVAWRLEGIRPKPGAQVLATSKRGDSERVPMILRHYVGAGEVLFHATDETWRWRWRTDDRYFAQYWGQAVRRLGRGHLAANRRGEQLTTDRARYEPGEPVRLQVRFRNPSQAPNDEKGVVVELRGANGSRREVTLLRRSYRRGVFESDVENLLPDEYEAQLLPSLGDIPSGVVRFEIKQPPRELARVVVEKQALQAAAKFSGGRMYTIDTAAQMFDDLPQPQQTERNALPARSLWNSHWIVGIFVLILTTEWLLRRRHGML